MRKLWKVGAGTKLTVVEIVPCLVNLRRRIAAVDAGIAWGGDIEPTSLVFDLALQWRCHITFRQLNFEFALEARRTVEQLAA